MDDTNHPPPQAAAAASDGNGYVSTYCVKCRCKTEWLGPTVLRILRNKWTPAILGRCCRCKALKSTFVTRCYYDREMQKQKNMEMTKKKTSDFIEAYKNKTILWDSTHPHNGHPLCRKKAWQLLASETLLTVDKCKVKVNNLRMHYSKTNARIERYHLSGKEMDEFVWHAYKKLDFLAQTFRSKKKPVIKNKAPSPKPIANLNTNTDVQNYNVDNLTEIGRSIRCGLDKKNTIDGRQISNPIKERQIPLEDRPERRENLLQITGAQNPTTHVNSAFHLYDKKMAVGPVTSNNESDNFASVENEIKCKSIAEFIGRKLKSYPLQIRDSVQNSIYYILLEADALMLN